MILQHEFVDFIPESLEEGVIYISLTYRTAIHKCVCGCGNEVATVISPVGWTLSFDGDTISLNPSIGNWNFECQSHYFITNSRVEHCAKWDAEKIRRGRARDEKIRKSYFKKK